MKKLSVMFVTLLLATACPAVFAQQTPPAGAHGGGMAHPQTPPATGEMLDLANKLVDAINKQDTATLQKMLAPDAVLLDEDGHAPPATRWINKIATATPPKQITISATHGQMWGDTGWVSFNYSMQETYQGSPRTVDGTASIVAQKAADGAWQIKLIHAALKQRVAGLTQ